MHIRRIHQLIKLKWNQLDSNNRVNLPPAQLDDVINTVIDDYVEIFFSGNLTKPYRFGFEVTQQRIDMLSTLVESKTLEAIANDDVYEADFGKLDPPYSHIVRASIKTDCGLATINRVQHNDLTEVLRDPNRAPSKTWNRVVATLRRSSSGADSTSLYIYTNNLLSVEDVTIEYIRLPRRVFYGGYNSLEFNLGNINNYKAVDPPVTTDIPEQYHSLLVDMVVQELSRIFTSPDSYQLQTDKILTKT